MEFPEILICNANLMVKTYLKKRNISENLTRYLQKTFFLDSKEFEDNLEQYQHVEKQYKELLTAYPKQDIREFMIQASVRCETFLMKCVFNNYNTFNCCENAVPTFDKVRGGCFLLTDIGAQKDASYGGLIVLMEIDTSVASKGQFATKSAGAVIQIHHSYDPTYNGEIMLPLESVVSIGIRVGSALCNRCGTST